MRTINTFYGITVDISEEVVKNYSEDLTGYPTLARKLEFFVELDSRYLRDVLLKRGHNKLNTIRMLEAHGNSNAKRGYLYADLDPDGSKLIWKPVDAWINEHEGKYEILYITTCNEGRIQLKPRKSTLVYPIGKYSGAMMIEESMKGIKCEELIILEPNK